MPSAADPPPVEPDELTEFMLRPDSYPDAASRVELVETRISRVFLTDRFVYKLKKPVRFEFLDFSTRAARREACRDEVRLNRRLARNAYLGVVPVWRDARGKFVLGKPCDPDDPAFASEANMEDAVEWLVAMRRLDHERMLDRLIERGTLADEQVQELAATLGSFYAVQPLSKLTPSEYRGAILHHVRANRADLSAAAPAAEHRRIRKTHAAQLAFLCRHRILFDARIAAGRIIDGHGDLRPEHVCLESPPVVYDCVEFSAELRRIDTADELAFLLMECTRLGRRDVGQTILAAYEQASGDRPPDALTAFYESYRACVRAKVAALRLAQQSGDKAQATEHELRQYLELAEQSLPRFHRPTLYVMRGLMGSGKSTLAAAIAESLGIERVRTDVIRQELQGTTNAPAAFGTGAYTPRRRREVYVELLRRCRVLLSRGESVVADGTFLNAEELQLAEQTTGDVQAELLIVECRCAAELAKQRIATRLREGSDVSEARPELYDRQAAAAAPVPSELRSVTVDTALPAAAQLAALWDQSQHSVNE